MAIDAASYIQANHPKSILDLIDEKTLGHLLDGFAYRLQAGASIIYSPELPASHSTLKQRSFMYDKRFASEVAHPLCAMYRSVPKHNILCEMCERSIALKYYDREWDGPRLYRCHLQLWEMSYPLRANQNLVGVLIAGQIILKESNVTTASLLRENPPPLPVYWPHTSGPDQQSDVLRALRVEAMPESFPEIQKLMENPGQDFEVNPETLSKRCHDFLDLGQTIESLVRQFHSLSVESAEKILLDNVARELTLATSTQEAWWQAVASVCGELEEASALGPIQIYFREGSQYIEKIRWGQVLGRDAPRKFPARLGFEIPVDEAVPTSHPSVHEICLQIGESKPKDDWLFRYDSETAEEHGFSLVFRWQGPADKFAEEFCRTLAIRAQIADLLFRSREDQLAFQKRVKEISHAAKTPLMVAETEIQRARRSLNGIDPEVEVAEHIDRVADAIEDAAAELAQLYGVSPAARTPCDLRRILSASADKMRPLAEAKRCRILLTSPDYSVSSRVCEPEIMLAVRNLLDNAIKYSFDDHEVRIVLRVLAAGKAYIEISNYGVGFPMERREDIMKKGARGSVLDPLRPSGRPGTGLGVPISAAILQNHGGTLDLESQPTKGTEPGTWLNCVTRARVTLPLS
jgi:signal transduction histidine kinase